MAGAWLREESPELAIDRILDAAEKAFVPRGVASVGMAEIADAAGCSRGTLYRYFRSRHELHLAYVKREAQEIAERVQEETSGVRDPRRRLVAFLQGALRETRANPATAAWFAPASSGLAARMALGPELIEAFTTGFGSRMAASGGAARGARLRTRWIVRVIVSLLAHPAASAAEERALLERFVVPGLAPSRRDPTRG